MIFGRWKNYSRMIVYLHWIRKCNRTRSRDMWLLYEFYDWQWERILKPRFCCWWTWRFEVNCMEILEHVFHGWSLENVWLRLIFKKKLQQMRIQRLWYKIIGFSKQHYSGPACVLPNLIILDLSIVTFAMSTDIRILRMSMSMDTIYGQNEFHKTLDFFF